MRILLGILTGSILFYSTASAENCDPVEVAVRVEQAAFAQRIPTRPPTPLSALRVLPNRESNQTYRVSLGNGTVLIARAHRRFGQAPADSDWERRVSVLMNLLGLSSPIVLPAPQWMHIPLNTFASAEPRIRTWTLQPELQNVQTVNEILQETLGLHAFLVALSEPNNAEWPNLGMQSRRTFWERLLRLRHLGPPLPNAVPSSLDEVASQVRAMATASRDRWIQAVLEPILGTARWEQVGVHSLMRHSLDADADTNGGNFLVGRRGTVSSVDFPELDQASLRMSEFSPYSMLAGYAVDLPSFFVTTAAHRISPTPTRFAWALERASVIAGVPQIEATRRHEIVERYRALLARLRVAR